MKRMLVTIMAGVTFAACGGSGPSTADGEAAFAEWYRQNEDRRMEALAGAEGIVDPEALRHSQAEGVAAAREACAAIDETADGDPVAKVELSVRLENSLTARYFIDAAIRWVCPGREDVIERLIEEGTVDQREKCAEVPDALGCHLSGGSDPLAET